VPISLRHAAHADIPAIRALIARSARGLSKAEYRPSQIEGALKGAFGVDTQLIDDQTYFVAEEDGEIVGCGGWSHRATLFGGDHTQGRNAALVDPATEPARMRAMYTHPDYARRGLGRFILAESEGQARERGFRRATLVATMAGLPLYRACDYREVEHFREATPTGVSVPLVRMEKPLVL